MLREKVGEIPVVILAGGKGTRLGNEYGLRPKPLVCIGPYPILMHIIFLYLKSGFRKFYICLGFRSEDFKDYFRNIASEINTDLFRLSCLQLEKRFSQSLDLNIDFEFEVRLLDTGEDSTTAKRIKMSIDEFDSEMFCATYGDGVANLDIFNVLKFHIEKKFPISLTAFHPPSRFGEVIVNSENSVVNFQEKQLSRTLVNGGFFVMNRSIQKDIDAELPLEIGLLSSYCQQGKLGAYISENYWQMMDTPREVEILNNLYKQGIAPWLTGREIV